MQTLNIKVNNYAKCQMVGRFLVCVVIYLWVCVCVCVCVHDINFIDVLLIYVRISNNASRLKKARVYNFIKQMIVYCNRETRNCRFWFLFSFCHSHFIGTKAIHIFFVTTTLKMNVKVNNMRQIDGKNNTCFIYSHSSFHQWRV